MQQSGLIIGATAVGKDKTVSTFANTCGVAASWCVAAPGGNPAERGGTDPAATPGIYSTLPFGNPPPAGPGYGFEYGTSMAAPMVSGALGLLSGAYPDYDSQDLAHVLFATAENVGGQAADNSVYGYGMIRLDRAVAGPTTLAAGAVQHVAYQQMIYWSQPLTTAGGFTKTGAGYLIVAGRTSVAGDVTASGGALGVDGTLNLATKMTVEQGATLAGFGWINGDTVINGVLNAGQLPNYGDLILNNGGVLPAGIPLSGTSPGTLTLNGNVALGASANTRVNVDGPLQVPGGPATYDKIVVEGANHAFAANGVLTPVLRGNPGGANNYVPSIGAVFPFLTALNGASITGSFASLIQPTVGLAPNARFDVVYAPYVLALDVTPASFATLAATLRPDAGGDTSSWGPQFQGRAHPRCNAWRSVNFAPPCDLIASQAAWRRLRARQLFRLLVEALLSWVSAPVGSGAKKTFALVSTLIEEYAAGAARSATVDWLDPSVIEADGKTELQATIMTALPDPADMVMGWTANGI